MTKDLIVLYFLQKLVLKALNSIVPLFSSYNVIKCAFLGVILAARRLKSHVCQVPSANDLWFQIYVSLRTRQHTMAAQNEGVTKAIAGFYWEVQRRFSWSSYDLRPNIIPASFFWVKCLRFSPCHKQDFTKRPGDFQRFPTNYWRLPNVAKS